MKAEKVREMSAEELRSREKELQEQLFRLRFQKSIGQLDNALKMREVRRDIARLKTVQRQKEREGAEKAQRGPAADAGQGRRAEGAEVKR